MSTKVTASQTSWDAKVSFWNGGKPGLWPPEGTSVCALVASAIFKCEQQQERDQQREDAERLGDREAEDQVAELALGGRRIAQGGGEVVAEDRADADARAAHADAGNAGANIFRSDRIHDESSFRGLEGSGAFNGPDEARR